MIVSELITNSVRHAFCDRGGSIRIELNKSGPFAKCCVMDNGSSRSSYKPGEGLKIVEALAKELNGQINYRFGPEGALSTLTFPIDGDDCNHKLRTQVQLLPNKPIRSFAEKRHTRFHTKNYAYLPAHQDRLAAGHDALRQAHLENEMRG